MSSTILTNWTVYYAADVGAGAGYKQIKWTGAGAPETNTTTTNELYSALADLFSDPNQNEADDTVPMRAVTPRVYEIGAFDAGDLEPWFIDPDSIQHLTGGSIQTDGWERTLPGDGTGDIGIVRITRTGTNIVAGDIGATITNSTNGDDGILLHVDGANLWIRPDTNALTDDWDSTSGTITCNGHSDTQASAGVTGERLWSNIYTIGTLVDNTTLAVFQDSTEITPFWDTGHLDRLFLINDDFDTGLIDYGLVTIFARQYSNLYDHFATDASVGGRIPVPLATFDDTSNTSGFLTFTGDAGTDTFEAGEIIQEDVETDKQAIITSVAGTSSDPVLEYYLIGSTLTDFEDNDDITGQSSGATCNVAGSTSTTGPATISGVTITFGASTHDIGNGNGDQPYDVEIDCSEETLADIYEYLKYLTRRGSSTSINGHTGEQYTGVGDIRLSYESQTGNFTEGLTVTGATSGATGIIVADHDSGTSGALVLRDTTGTFGTSEIITDTSSGSATTLASSTYENIASTKQAPFGTFGGGTFFGARGVYLYNMASADASNYILIDSTGTEQTPPDYVTLTVTNIASGDRVGMFLATGDNNTVNKTQFNIQQSHTAPVAYIRVEEEIPDDTPTSGTIRVVRRNAATTIIDEQRYSYSAFSNTNQPTYSEFTLSGTTTQDYDTDDTTYVPFLDEVATGTSVSTAVIYTSDRYVTTRVRRKGYLPFVTKGQITTSGISVTAVKTTDTITD